ncbi:MAG: bifunctional lysylphosphatidylglycerol synthetase/lysine--tRNA ligase LysX [Nakamurella sp.]
MTLPSELIARLMRRVVLAAAIWSAVSIPLRGHHWSWPLTVDMAFGVLNVPAEPSLFTAAVMFLMAAALRRRLRAALVVVVVFEVAIALAQLAAAILRLTNDELVRAAGVHIGQGRLVYLAVSGLAGVLVVVVVWSCRASFPARLRARAWWTALIALLAGILASAGITLVLTEAYPGALSEGSRIWWSVRIALGAITDLEGVPVVRGAIGTHWVATVGGLLSALAVLGAVWVFTRSARASQLLSAADEIGVRRLLQSHGDRDSLGYFATRRDKSVVFAPNGAAAVGYRVVASVSLASADPIGPVSAWPAAITVWLTEAHSHGWYAAVLASGERATEAYVAAGLKALSLGDEAIIDVDEFTLRGPAMRPVRQAVTRIRRAGYRLQMRRHGDIPAVELTELQRLADLWRGDATERGFSMALGRLGDPSDERCLMVTSHDSDGAVRGLLSFVPWGAHGLSLDLMRRDSQAENGLIEYMVAGLVADSPGIGVRRISLNFAMFRSVFGAIDQVGAGPIVRLTGALLSVASRFWQVESLYRANAKYLPAWVPRYLCYDPALPLARAAVAAGMAEGFLPGGSVWPLPRDPDELILAVGGTSTVDGPTMPFLKAVHACEQTTKPLRPRRRVSQQQRARRAKIELLQAAGMDPYPVTVPRSCQIAEVQARHQGLLAGQKTGEIVSLAGRVRALRDFGGVTFAELQGGGAAIQLMLTADHTPQPCRQLWRRTVDLGDQVSVSGEIATSDSGELSIVVTDWMMAAKCLRPLPGARAGLVDSQVRARRRHVDLLVNPTAMRTLRTHSVVVDALRDTLKAKGFVEVETPILQLTAGGATARPFRTHSGAHDADLYLRIAPELQLKQLCVAGMDRIFELGRNFRNEGVDTTHNPEFTVVEVYEAWSDYHGMRELTEALIREAAERVGAFSPPAAPRRGGIDGHHEALGVAELAGDWAVVDVHEAVSRACGEPVDPGTPLRRLRELCAEHSVTCALGADAGDVLVTLYEALVEKQTTAPTFYVDFPLSVCPLTRPHRDDARLAERWDLVAGGMEIATAYSELVDPIDQRARLEVQAQRGALGDPEAMHVDETFLDALEYAMPPTGGLGIGVDRLVMMLTGASIRDTLAFPFARPM